MKNVSLIAIALTMVAYTVVAAQDEPYANHTKETTLRSSTRDSDPMRETLVEQIKRLGAETETFDRIHEALLKGYDGTASAALRNNLVGLKLGGTTADLIAATMGSVEEYRCRLLADSRSNTLMANRHRLKADLGQRALDKLADEVVEVREKMARLSENPAAAAELAHEIELKTADIENLLNKRDAHVALADRFARFAKTDNVELDDLLTLKRNLELFARAEKHHVERLNLAIEAQSLEIVRNERRPIRDAIEFTLTNLAPERNRPVVIETSSVDEQTRIKEVSQRHIRPREPNSARVEALLRKAEERLKSRTPLEAE
jgi:hypothetical protein